MRQLRKRRERLKNAESLKGDLMELDDAIKSRRSVRRWSDKDIPKEMLFQLVEAARYAPSSCNRQSVKLLIVAKKENVKFLGGITYGGTGYAHKAAAIILVLADVRVYPLPLERHTPYLDGAAAIQNILLAANQLGLGAVWLNWVASEANEEKARKRFKIVKHFLPVSMVALGFPAVKPERPARKNIEEYAIFENF